MKTIPTRSPKPTPKRRGFARFGALMLGGALAGFLSLSAGCETFDSPPRAAIEGVVDDQLFDTNAPIVVRFSEPVEAATLKATVIKFETDIEGNLLDEDADPNTNLEILGQYPPLDSEDDRFDVVAEGVLSEDRLSLTFAPKRTPPVGSALALVLESGLKDDKGNATTVREIVKFSYEFKCTGQSGSAVVPTGYYFFLLNVEKPIATQIQLIADLRVDPATGKFTGRFTNADRNRNLSCPGGCSSDTTCRTLPAPECVPPSTKGGSADEYPDFGPNGEGETGYSFEGTGCVEDQSGNTAAFANAPVDAIIKKPPVTVKGIRMSAQWILGDDGVLRAAGSFTSDAVFLGNVESGKGTGTFVGRLIPPAEAPPNIPPPTGFEPQMSQ